MSVETLNVHTINPLVELGTGEAVARHLATSDHAPQNKRKQTKIQERDIDIRVSASNKRNELCD